MARTAIQVHVINLIEFRLKKSFRGLLSAKSFVVVVITPPLPRDGGTARTAV